MRTLIIMLGITNILLATSITLWVKNISDRKYELIEESYQNGVNNAFIKESDIKKLIVRGDGGEITLTNGSFFNCTTIEQIIPNGLIYPTINWGDMWCSYPNYSKRKVLKVIK